MKDSQFRGVLGRPPGGDTRDYRVVSHDDRPAVSVTRQGAEEFCAKLSALPEEKQARRRYRLPTQAEWIRARDTRSGPFSWFETLRAPLHWFVCEICADDCRRTWSPAEIER